jgi:hypothetical protein
MRHDWILHGKFILVATLFLAFWGVVAWRNGPNGFLFFSWLSVLIVFVSIDIMVFAETLRLAK